MASGDSDSNNKQLLSQATLVLYLLAAYTIAKAAYTIRLRAIDEYGPVIHEFDPYFNFRATEVRSCVVPTYARLTQCIAPLQYLYWNGWRRFFTWFDHSVWYPLGRPVGTTIYPVRSSVQNNHLGTHSSTCLGYAIHSGVSKIIHIPIHVAQ